jgi:hypothetical protein
VWIWLIQAVGGKISWPMKFTMMPSAAFNGGIDIEIAIDKTSGGNCERGHGRG